MDIKEFPKKSLKEIYQGLPTRKQVVHPRKELVRYLADLTKRNEKTVYKWFTLGQNPDALAQSVISENLGIPVSVLFPSDNN